MTHSSWLDKPRFWIVVLAASAACAFGVLRYFGEAFPVLDLEVRMSRAAAVDSARHIAAAQKLSTATLTHAAASFDGDVAVQTFVELEGGGKPALKKLVDGDEFTLHKWRVRLYEPGVEREVWIAFTPAGAPSGFSSRIPEAAPGAALSSDAARAIAVDAARRDWNVDFARYRPLTASSVTRPGKRVDHEFVYERGDASPGEGRFRLRMDVSGDTLTRLQRSVYVPEAFTRRYETMRSSNNTIAAFAGSAAGLLYGFGGCLGGMVWLMRRGAWQWKPAARWAGVVALLLGASLLASLPASWLAYDTATSASTHLALRVLGAIGGAAVSWPLLLLVFASAEGLGRVAFGSHPQLWRAWLAPAGASRSVWGRTLAGYAWIGFDLAFIAVFYFLVQRYLGWWSPSDTLIDPNILGNAQPWIAPVANSLQAGMLEECLFRAIPLAGAALIGRRFKRERLFVVVALVLQALVFGSAHANYPAQPAYARPVELFVPSLVWGVVYLRYGLIPGILFHFGFDLVLMSIPLFVTDVPGIGFDRAMVIAALLVPIAVLVWRRVQAGRLVDLPDSERNAAAVPLARAHEAAHGASSTFEGSPTGAPTAAPLAELSRALTALLLAGGVAGALGFVMRAGAPPDVPPLSVSRDQAVTLAKNALAARGVTLDSGWQTQARAEASSDPSASRFVWREGGARAFASLIGNAIAPPHWEVRFARFDGEVANRETWRVVVARDAPPPDGIRVVEHDLPEARAGKRLSEADARAIAETWLARWFALSASSLRRVSAESTERPRRLDWNFVYADPARPVPSGGEARVVVEVDGDEVVSLGRFLFVPDAWKRDERHRNERLVFARAALGVAGFALAVWLLVVAFRRLIRRDVSRSAALVGGAIGFVGVVGAGLLNLNASEFGFSVGEPWGAQMLRLALKWLAGGIGAALLSALMVGVGVRIASRAASLRPPADTTWRLWRDGLAIALVVRGLSGLTSSLQTRSDATLPAVSEAHSLLPFASAALDNLGLVSLTGTATIVAMMLASRHGWHAWLVAGGFVAFGVLGVASRPGADLALVASGVLGGVVVWGAYRLFILPRPWILPPTLLWIALFGALSKALSPAYPGALASALAAALAGIASYAVWNRLCSSDRAHISAAPPPLR